MPPIENPNVCRCYHFNLILSLRRWIQGKQYHQNHLQIHGKIVIITGGNGGIGKATALALAKRGGRIYLACRDLKKAEQVQMEIIENTGNTNVLIRYLDLSSFESIRRFVDE